MQVGRQLSSATPALRESDARELAQRLSVVARRSPIEGLIEITFRCNLRCAHCYVNRPARDGRAERSELSLTELKRLIDESAAAGCLFLTFSGGEPLLRPDFPALYRHAVRAGLIVTVFTNGTLVTDAIAGLFDDLRPDSVEISLYGLTRETYERITGVRGSHGLCLAGIERLRSRGIALRLKTMALTWNAHELADLKRFAEGLGAPFRFDGQLNPRIDCGSSCYRALQLTPEALQLLDASFEGRLDEMRRAFDHAQRRAPKENVAVFDCAAGRTTFTIDPGGRLLPCPLLRRTAFDLRQGSFAQGWNGPLAAAVERSWRTSSPCRSCALMSLCDSCPGANELETGDVESPVATFCRLAHRRAAAILGPAAGHRPDAACCLPREPQPA